MPKTSKNIAEKLASLSAEKRLLLFQQLEEQSRKIQLTDRPIITRRDQTTTVCPLSFAQQRLWFIDQLEPGNATYNIFSGMRLRGALDVAGLEQGFQQVIQRHESLRTTFQTVDGQPQQVIAADLPVSLTHVDLSALSPAEQEHEAQRLGQAEAQRPFDLASGPLLRCTLMRLGQREHILLLTMHHIISDGWSMDVLFRETVALALAQPLPALALQYADFSIWQRNWLQGEVLEDQLGYWKKQLAEVPSALNLPTDRARPPVQSFRGARLPLHFSAELSQQLQTLSRQHDATLFMTLLTAFTFLLSRYSGQTDIVIGSPVANRNRAELEGLIGFFVNTLALRIDLAANPSFSQAIQRIREVCLGAYDHQDVPFEKLVDEVRVARDLSRNPLFQVMFVLQNTPLNLPDLGDVQVEPLQVENDLAHFDITLSLQETPAGLSGALEFNTDLFEPETIQRMLEHFRVLVEGVVANPQQPLAELPLLTSAERQQILVDWNDTAIDYPHETCIHHLFEAQVEKTPDAVALVFEDQQLSYRELNECANQLAHHLQKLGVGPDVPVGICVERSLEMVIGILGILKAGGAYLPLDPAYPKERLAFMTEDCGISLLLTQFHLCDQLPKHKMQVICLDADWGRITTEPTTNPFCSSITQNLAYIIYTSGSTGQPKGVQVTHHGLFNVSMAQQKLFSVSSTDRILQLASLSFDASVFELVMALCSGAALYLETRETLLPGLDFALQLKNLGITGITITPSALANTPFMDLLALRVISVAGEACSAELISRWAQDRQFFNLYGPTENTIWSTATACVESNIKKPHIGCPITNTQGYILDKEQQPVPIGVPGELYISGAGLARGYLNRADLTAEKFIPNPFSQTPGARMYRTGDLARWLPASRGNIEYVGRIDQQVKIRGFRIELGEIEAAISQHPAVREAVVLAREDSPGSKQLVAYLVTENDLPIEELRSHLKTRLPDYMLPAAFVLLDQLPLTPNGKVDRKALPAPSGERPSLAQTYTAPRTPAEQILADIWKDMLHIDEVGIHDNFFELGGDSIISIQVIARAHQSGLQITPRQLFQHPTITELARLAGNMSISLAEQGILVGLLPLTPIQHWFFEKDLPHPDHWNQAVLLKVLLPIDIHLLNEAWQAVIAHHDILRARFEYTRFGWQQYYTTPDDANPLRIVDLSTLEDDQQKIAIEDEANKLQTQLNLKTGPVLQIAYFNLGQNQPARLFIVLHHLIVDGVSWRILLEDLQTAYGQCSHQQNVTLPPKTTSLRQWTQRLTSHAQSVEQQKELQFWLNQPWQDVISLPCDHQSTDLNLEGSARNIAVELTEDETYKLLHEVHEAYHTQINDLLLAALALTLAHWGRHHTWLVNLEGHGREDLFQDIDFSRTVGWFTSLFPVLLQVNAKNDLGQILKNVKEQLRMLPQRGLGFGLLRYLSTSPEIVQQLQALPAAQLSFNYLGQLDHVIGNSSIFAPASENYGPTHNPLAQRSHLIEINASVIGGRLLTSWTYSPATHHPDTIQRIADQFTQTLRNLIAHCLTPKNGGFTPSDFQKIKMSQEELDDLMTELTDNVTK